jgi:hypothetical protein
MTLFGRSMRRRFPGRDYEPQSQGEVQRDLDTSASVGITWTKKIVDDAAYTEPMWLGDLSAAPIALVVRVVDKQDQEGAVFCGTGVHFVWDGEDKGARITSIDGMSALGDGHKYQFTFLVAEGSDE